MGFYMVWAVGVLRDGRLGMWVMGSTLAQTNMEVL